MAAALSLLLCWALTPALSAAAAPPTPGTKVATSKGPVGWQSYRRMDLMANLRQGEQLAQFSSFDRTGGNDDGFEGTYSCLRHEPSGRCVIAEAKGAGEISSMWFTYRPETVAPIGELVVELDGREVLRGNLNDIVHGEAGAPFVWPLVGSSADTMGGAVIKVPMPYSRSMRVTTQNNPHFYHVTYRKFADARGVRTFDPRDRALDVVQRLRGFGVGDPKPAAAGASTQRAGVDLAPGAALSLPLAGGPRQVSQLRLELPEVITSPFVHDDGRAFSPGGSAFTVAVAPRNEGVRLTRRYDPKIGHQLATVLVDGEKVGEWRNGPSTPPDTWADQAIEIPAALTAGKSRLRVRNEYVSSSLDVNEFRYDVHSLVGGEWVRTDVLDLGPNHPGDEAAHDYVITGQRWEGLGVFRYPAEPDRVAASDEILQGLRLRISFDGQTTVDAPVGDFFGAGLGKYEVRSLLQSVDTTANGAFTSWWPMPYTQRATVELVNESGRPVSGGSLAITSAPDRSLTGSRPFGYFHATHHRADTEPGREWSFLGADSGQGVFYGASNTMRGNIPHGGPIHPLNYLEGDERIYPDGAQGPSVVGTGSEDFYESGWYFMDAEANHREAVPYAMPLAGAVGSEQRQDGCAHACLGAYRLMVADAVPFGAGLDVEIEHGPDSDRPANYSSVSYWYGRPEASLAETDLVDAGDDGSRAEHGYRADGETRGRLESTFEGRGDTTPVTRNTTAAAGSVSFTVATREDNVGVRLHRVSDQARAGQHATVYVDGRRVGEWFQPLGNQHSRWLEDAFDLPAWATAGKKSVHVRLEPAAGAPPWSASAYRALTYSGSTHAPAD